MTSRDETNAELAPRCRVVLERCLRWRRVDLGVVQRRDLLECLSVRSHGRSGRAMSRRAWGRWMRLVLLVRRLLRPRPYRRLRGSLLACRSGRRPLDAALIELLARYVGLHRVASDLRLTPVQREELSGAFAICCAESLHLSSRRWRAWAHRRLDEALKRSVPWPLPLPFAPSPSRAPPPNPSGQAA